MNVLHSTLQYLFYKGYDIEPKPGIGWVAVNSDTYRNKFGSIVVAGATLAEVKSHIDTFGHHV